jgi:hypothetical protein
LKVFADLKKILKKFKNMSPNTQRVSLRKKNAQAHYLLTSKSVMKNKNKPSMPSWTYV